MNTIPKCPDCQVPMDAGHVLDHSDVVKYPACWQPGVPPEAGKFLGIFQSEQTTRVNYDEKRMIVSFCCPECGLLREYAPRKG